MVRGAFQKEEGVRAEGREKKRDERGRERERKEEKGRRREEREEFKECYSASASHLPRGCR